MWCVVMYCRIGMWGWIQVCSFQWVEVLCVLQIWLQCYFCIVYISVDDLLFSGVLWQQSVAPTAPWHNRHVYCPQKRYPFKGNVRWCFSVSGPGSSFHMICRCWNLRLDTIMMTIYWSWTERTPGCSCVGRECILVVVEMHSDWAAFVHHRRYWWNHFLVWFGVNNIISIRSVHSSLSSSNLRSKLFKWHRLFKILPFPPQNSLSLYIFWTVDD